jgi:hypothetical protein
MDSEVSWGDLIVRSFDDFRYNLIVEESSNPEESLIESEEYKLYKILIEKLNNEDQNLIQFFLNWDDIWDNYTRIVQLLQNELKKKV